MSSIFISHSSKDNSLAKEFERRLAQQNHHSVFLDLRHNQEENYERLWKGLREMDVIGIERRPWMPLTVNELYIFAKALTLAHNGV